MSWTVTSLLCFSGAQTEPGAGGRPPEEGQGGGGGDPEAGPGAQSQGEVERGERECYYYDMIASHM